MDEKPTYEELEKKIQGLELAALDSERVKEKLHTSEEKFRILYNNSPDMHVSVSPHNSSILLCNDTLLRKTGYLREEIIGFPIFKLYHNDCMDEVKKCFQQFIETGAIQDKELILKRKDGSKIDVSLNVNAVKDEAGEILHSVSSFRDITEQKALEKLGRKVNQLNEDLLAPGSLTEKLKRITDGVVKIFKADFARIWITKTGDLCDSGCPHAEFVEGPHVCKRRDACLQLLSSSGRYTHIDGGHRRVPYDCYIIGRIASGEVSKFFTNDIAHEPWIHDKGWAGKLGLKSLAGYILISESGEPIGVFALFSKQTISSDARTLLESLAGITSQVIQSSLKEEALKVSEELYRKLFNSSKDAIMTLGPPSWKFTSGNPAIIDMFGVKDEEEFTTLGPWEVSPENQPDGQPSLEKAKQMIQTAMENGSNFFEWTHKKLNGAEFLATVLLTKVELKDKTFLQATVRDITEQKQHEAALQRSEAKFRGLVESTSDWIWEVNKEGVYTYASPQVELILGYRPEEIIGRTPFDLMPQEEAERNSKLFKDVLENSEPIVAMENVNIDKEGHHIILETSGVPYFNEAGKVIGYRGIDRDITDRKKAEKALRESEIKHKTLVDNIPGMIYRAYADWSAEVISGSEEICGYTKKELMSKEDNWLSIIHPDDKEKIFKNGSKLTLTQKNIVQEYRIINRNGRVRWVEDRKTSIFSETGELSGIDGVVFDVTERKMAEKKLEERTKTLNEILENVGDGICVCHNISEWPHVKFTHWNPRMTEISGYTLEEINRLGWYQTMYPDPEVQQRAIERMGRMRQGDDILSEEWVVTAKDGNQKALFISTSVLKEENGRIYVLALMKDISDRKRAEEEKRKVLEFTAEQSKHALIGQVAGKMAHDFNNVLMGIMGNAQLALMHCDDEKVKGKLENINEFSERGREITNNLMSFSKDQEPKQTHFRIEDKIELALKIFEKELSATKVSRNYKSGIPELLADPGMIQDVLVNLIQNSIHAMSKVKKPRLKLKAYSRDDKVYFEIEDNGCGIPKEHHNSIYTPSFTLKGGHDKTGSYKPEIKGTGYGMSNVKKYIVEKHKGDIFLESEVGKGTRITIAFKIIRDHLSSDEKKEVVKNQIYDKRRILLVEDEHAIADVQYQILTREPFGHIVSTAVNGQMAIDIFDRNRFDAVSLDYMLPGNFSGLDVYNHIREKDKDIPVMFISGNIEFLESMQRLKEKDPNLEHMSKPVDNLDYVNKINELIGRSINKL